MTGIYLKLEKKNQIVKNTWQIFDTYYTVYIAYIVFQLYISFYLSATSVCQ